MNIEICQTDLFNPDLIALIAQLDAYQEALYPAESNHTESIASMAQKKTFVYIATRQGRALGCAILFQPESTYPEIKRVFVIPDCRGHGIASMLVTALLEKSISLNLKYVYLETGIHQPEAVKLYQRLGFEFTSEFGCYQYDPLSFYMVKTVASCHSVKDKTER
ncbi:GNAT family N-acetyltransferase [Yersinia sp. 2542 StPb PI]|uniref:GNAT family N-acetyltransferase n=1 Tax=Yersinia sp. 2542 StPb PI TaxID=3117408 RepID=UPI003B2820E4